MVLAETENTYLFEVGTGANKIQIRQAVESVFGVRVDDVRTLNVRGKNKRFGRHTGKRSNWKKAYVTLAEGNTLDFFEA
jgi:large subunit ribosomal protein L23